MPMSTGTHSVALAARRPAAPLAPRAFRRGMAQSAVMRWTGIAVLVILVIGVVVYMVRDSKAEVATTTGPVSQEDYASTKPGGDAPPPTPDELANMTTSPDDIAAEDRGPATLIEVKADVAATDLIENLKELQIGQKFNVKTEKGIELLQFDPAHFSYQDCKMMVVVTDPTGKELDRIKGLTRDGARRKMLEINDATHNVESVVDPDEPAKFLARDHDYVITVHGDPVDELNEDTKNAFQLDRTFYIANPVKK